MCLNKSLQFMDNQLVIPVFEDMVFVGGDGPWEKYFNSCWMLVRGLGMLLLRKIGQLMVIG